MSFTFLIMFGFSIQIKNVDRKIVAKIFNDSCWKPFVYQFLRLVFEVRYHKIFSQPFSKFGTEKLLYSSEHSFKLSVLSLQMLYNRLVIFLTKRQANSSLITLDIYVHMARFVFRKKTARDLNIPNIPLKKPHIIVWETSISRVLAHYDKVSIRKLYFFYRLSLYNFFFDFLKQIS